MKHSNTAHRLNNLPFYLYPTIDKATSTARQRGLNIIDLSLGEPGFRTPKNISDVLKDACVKPEMQCYGNIQGYPALRESISKWYFKRFGVKLNSEEEVVTFIGSKEGIALLPLAYINPGDIVLIPDPGYPTYRYAAAFAGAKLETFPIRPENNYEPDFNEIPESVAEKAKIIYLNYPNNPTGATVDKTFFEKVVAFAKKHNILVSHDAAYTELTYDGYKAPSFLEASGAKDVGVEFHTLSKTFSMTGWRIGFGVGNKKIIKALLEAKRVISTGHFPAIEMAGCEALNHKSIDLEHNNQILKARRDLTIQELHKLDIAIDPPKGAFFVWFPIPKGESSLDFTTRLILETGVVTFPGIGYGENGEGYIRISFTQDLPLLAEAFKRIKKYFNNFEHKHICSGNVGNKQDGVLKLRS